MIFAMSCRICGCSMLRASGKVLRADAIYCSAAHRIAAYRQRGRELYANWIALPLPSEAMDPEMAITWQAPEGSLLYRLACPGTHGGSRYFPKGRRLTLSPFEDPEVPRAGLYRAVYYDAWGDVLGEVDGILLLSPMLGLFVSQGDTTP